MVFRNEPSRKKQHRRKRQPWPLRRSRDAALRGRQDPAANTVPKPAWDVPVHSNCLPREGKIHPGTASVSKLTTTGTAPCLFHTSQPITCRDTRDLTPSRQKKQFIHHQAGRRNISARSQIPPPSSARGCGKGGKRGSALRCPTALQEALDCPAPSLHISELFLWKEREGCKPAFGRCTQSAFRNAAT